MLRSMYSGIGGMRNFQTKLDVIGNNIANVNTFGFKKGRTVFKDLVSQQLTGASTATDNRGGTNPQQIGLGSTLASIDTIQTQGSIQTTNRDLDIGISGDGFFIVNDGDMSYYSRAGNFYLDQQGNLVNSDGLRVQGYLADGDGNIDYAAGIGSLEIAAGQLMAPTATDFVEFRGNINADILSRDQVESLLNGLDSEESIRSVLIENGFSNRFINSLLEDIMDDDGDILGDIRVELLEQLRTNYYPTVPYEFVDSLGRVHELDLIFEKTESNMWEVGLMNENEFVELGTIPFNNSGVITGDLQYTLNIENGDYGINLEDAETLTIDINLTNITQFARNTTADVHHVTGNLDGTLNSYNISATGEIFGVFSNGEARRLGQIALANFNNPGGLSKAGDNLYEVSNNSGAAQVGVPGEDGRGKLTGAALEMSNVDLSEEFAEMIVAQRGFQANTRMITTSDEILQELVNLKR